ncbi:MAG TPA: hypothetical protein VNJ01_12015 [Bacteriovoracaceae bacterium]|nr:hypothetical protein [Bacteriovoracaceae bacterium]
MKSVLAAIIFSASFNAAAVGIDCLSAGGYYGEAHFSITAQTANIVAGNGFASVISEQLARETNGHVYNLSIKLPTDSCTSSANSLVDCRQLGATVLAQTHGNGSGSERFKADVSFRIKEIRGSKRSHRVTLSIDGKVAEMEFGSKEGMGSLGECVVR